MLTAWQNMKDREDLIKEELRLFGSSETLEMLAGGYNACISYDPDAGLVKYSSESCLPGRQQIAAFALKAGKMGYQVTMPNNAGKNVRKRGPTLEFLLTSPKGKEIRVSSKRRQGKEVIARTTVEFPYNINLGLAYLLYKLADLYEMDPLGEMPIGLTPEELKEYLDLEGYLVEEETEETAADANSGIEPQGNDVPKPFKALLDDMGF